MNDLVLKFCLHPRSWLFVAAVTLVVALVSLSGQVDTYRAVRSAYGEVSEQLAVAERTVREVALIEHRLVEERKKLEQLRARTLGEAAISEYRNEVVRLVRESGCQLRRLGLGQSQNRVWRDGDAVLATAPPEGKADSGFVLESRTVDMTVSGSLPGIQKFLDGLQSDGRIAHAKLMELRPDGANRRQVELSLEVWYYALSRKAPQSS